MESRVHASRVSYRQSATDSSINCRPEGRRRYPTYHPRDTQSGQQQQHIYGASTPLAVHQASHKNVVSVNPQVISRHVGRVVDGSDHVKGTLQLVKPMIHRYLQGSSHQDEVLPRHDRYYTDPMNADPATRKQSRKTATSLNHMAPASSFEDSVRRQVQDHGPSRTRYEARRASPLPQLAYEGKPLPRIGQSASSSDRRQTSHRPEKETCRDDADCDRPVHSPTSSVVPPPPTRIKKRVRIESPSIKGHQRSSAPSPPSTPTTYKRQDTTMIGRKDRKMAKPVALQSGLSLDEVEEEITCPM